MSGRRIEGGRINRDHPLRFTFDGMELAGFEGDTLESALLAHGVAVLGRSPRRLAPRGLMGFGAPAVQTALSPAVDAADLWLTNGLVADPLGGRGARAALPLAQAFRAWATRRAGAGAAHKAGFGALRRMFAAPARDAPLPTLSAPADVAHRQCDLLVIGAGPAGLAAARAATGAGRRVLLIHPGPAAGGGLLDLGETAPRIDGLAPAAWAEDMAEAIARAPDAHILPFCRAVDLDGANAATLVEQPPGGGVTIHHVRARRVIFATGARDRAMLFAGNDRPGVMSAKAALRVLRRQAVTPGRRAVLFAGHDLAWESAFALRDAGVAIAGIVDPRPDPARRAEAEAAGLPVFAASVITRARGDRRVKEVRVAARLDDGALGAERRLSCDTLLCSSGLDPDLGLLRAAGGTVQWDEAIAAFRPDRLPGEAMVVGAAAGDFSLSAAVIDAAAAGAVACGVEPSPPPLVSGEGAAPRFFGPWVPPQGARETVVDPEREITLTDLRLAVREGLDPPKSAARFASPDLAAESALSVNTLAVLADLRGRDLAMMTPAPQPTGLSVAALADPIAAPAAVSRRSPLHTALAEDGAAFVSQDGWTIAEQFGPVARECAAARRSAAVFDRSFGARTLITGLDARRFLIRLFGPRVEALEAGVVDLICADARGAFAEAALARLDRERYWLDAADGDAVRDWLKQEAAQEWSDPDLFITAVDDQWARLLLTGDGAGAILEALDPSGRLAAMAEGALIETALEGLPVAIARRAPFAAPGWEISIAAGYGDWLWRQLRALGAEPAGDAAMRVLRAERGAPEVVGGLGLGLGPAELGLAPGAASGRPHLVGLTPRHPRQRPAAGAPLIGDRRPGKPPVPVLGHVASVLTSPARGGVIAHGLLTDGLNRIGETVYAAPPKGAPIPLAVAHPDGLREEAE